MNYAKSKLLEQPSMSPDLHIIEHLGLYPKHFVCAATGPEVICTKSPISEMERLLACQRKCLQAVISAKCGSLSTKFCI